MQAAGRGVIWDQEIYDTFSYNQDRVFFHTFELEDCLAGLSFADEKEAKTFKKKLLDWKEEILRVIGRVLQPSSAVKLQSLFNGVLKDNL